MINIRPVSDLRNKYTEIEELVLRDEQPIYLTKNGYGSMVVMSIAQYSELIEKIEDIALEARFGCDDIEKALDEAEEEAINSNTKYYSHEEMMKMAREVIDGAK